MKEHPILFSGLMVRAILEGRKTQTRRVVKPQPACGCHYEINGSMSGAVHIATDAFEAKQFDRCWVPVLRGALDVAPHVLKCHYGQPGDRLWVREACRITFPEDEDGGPLVVPPVWYEADGDCPVPDGYGRVKPSIHMPRWASRITLEVTAVHVERVQDITEADALAEGIVVPVSEGSICFPVTGPMPFKEAETRPLAANFANLWDTINAKRAPWNSNPWVWVVEFKRVQA